MKNCIYIFFNVREPPYGRVILVHLIFHFSSFRVSSVHDFFQVTFFLMPFFVSEFAGFKNIYIFICKNKTGVKVLVEYPAKNASFFFTCSLSRSLVTATNSRYAPVISDMICNIPRTNPA